MGYRSTSAKHPTHDRSSIGALTHWRWILGGAIACLGLAHLAYHASYTLDDAYITYRYSRNLARGLGLVYNPGEYVKGYSNTIHTLLMTLPELFGRDPNPLSKALGVVAFLSVCLFAQRIYRADESPAVRDRSLWLQALLAGSVAIGVHFVSGLETGPYTALVLAAVVLRVEEQEHGGRPWSCLLFGAAALSRPEGIVFFAAMFAHDLIWRSAKGRFSRRDMLFYAVPPAIYASELLVSKLYYGQALPQTYYAKAHGAEGLFDGPQVLWRGLVAQTDPHAYLVKGLGQAGLGLVGLAVIPIALAFTRHRRRNWAFALAVCAQLVFIARAGDDWAPAFRFVVPLLPFLFSLAVEAIGGIAALTRRLERPVGWALASALLFQTVPAQLRESVEIQERRYVNAENKLNEGRFFTTLAPAGITLSSFDIGGQGYAAGGFDILDTGGLTTPRATDCRRHFDRCARYAALVMPELMRLHTNRRRDAFVSKTVRKLQPYLELEGGKYAIQRGLLLGSELPIWASRTAQAVGANLELVAHDIPAALLTGAQSQITLYWQRRSVAIPAMAARRLEWLGAGGHFGAAASEVVWNLTAVEAWQPDESFADLITIKAPPKAGRFELHVIVDQQRVVIASVEVLEPRASRGTAERLTAQAREVLSKHHEDIAIQLLERATQLSPASARDAYQLAVVARAARIRAAAQRMEAADALGALREAQRAKLLLHRAFWTSGRATRRLRSEIDANGALRKRLIDRLLAES
jgi:hypothetical protein